MSGGIEGRRVLGGRALGKSGRTALLLSCFAAMATAPAQTVGRFASVLDPEGLQAYALREEGRTPRADVQDGDEGIEGDSRAARAERFQRRLRRHPYLSTLAYEIDEGRGPFVFAVQKTREADRAEAERVVPACAPWFQELAQVFREEYAEPFDLLPRHGFEDLHVVVLAGRDAFDDFLRFTRQRTDESVLARYEPELRLLVLYQARSESAGVTSEERRHAELREAARFLIDAWRGETPTEPPFWLVQGLADRLAASDGRDPKSLRASGFPPALLSAFVELLREDALRELYWVDLGELLAISSWDEAAARARASAPDADAVSAARAAFALRLQALALVHYALQAEDLRAPFLAEARAALRGRRDPPPFVELFSGLELRRLQAELVRHAVLKHRGSQPAAALSDAELERVLDALASAPVRGASPASAAPPGDPARLLGALESETARFALALARMRSGDAEAAVPMLERIAAEGGALAARADRELERVRPWIALRDRFLEHLASSRQSFSLQYQGERLEAAALRFEGGELRLQSNRRRIGALRASEIDPLELAKLMSSGRLGFQADWVRIYPYVLGDLATWRRLIGSSPEEQLLREDGLNDYPERRGAIEAAARIEALAGGGPLEEAARARAALEDIRALWSEWRALDFVAALEPDLAALARSALLVCFRAEGLSAVLSGKLEELASGALRLSYDFSEEKQLADLPAVDPGRYPAGYGIEPTGIEPFSGWRAGRLALRGETARRHLLDLEGPMRLSFTYRLLDDGEGEPRLYFLAALCAGESSYAGCLNGFHVELFDKLRGRHRRDPEEPLGQYFNDVDYAVELLHDGERAVEMRRDRQLIGVLPCDALTSGGVLLWTSTRGTVLIDDLVIEGRPTRASLDALAARWVDEHLTELGLGGG